MTPSCFPSSRNRRRTSLRSGFTLVEMLISIVLGTVILGLIVATTITLGRSMCAVSNYFQLDSDSRNTLDELSRDVRNASTVTSISTNSLSMSGSSYQGIPFSFTYNWDGTNLWRTYAAATVTNTTLVVTNISIALSNCDYLCFSNFGRVPNTNFSFYAASTNETKMISVDWRCSRKILGQKLNTESLQTAKIVIRN